MDLVKSHLMYAVREEVEVIKEQIKELIEKYSQLEQENNLLKTLASPELASPSQSQFQAQLQTGSPPATSQPQGSTQRPAQPASQGSGPAAEPCALAELACAPSEPTGPDGRRCPSGNPPPQAPISSPAAKET
ncbi:TSC22 domain family protein 1-like [Tenrec ecaudatus]|uniref:TSC22 domain family protein 1-like n=1 Tax=Tenrec ecaudatus TaxID=94439 RepID=UPI003F5A35B3